MTRVFSMFSGVGGFELGLLASGADIELVGFCEDNKYASQILNKRFKGVTNYGDATKLISEEIPDFDLLVGGFPCQAFSVAGKQRGFDDTRGTLFFEVARILRDKKPKHFILENVRGLLSHDKGRTLQTIFGVLSDLGYEYQWEVLNSKNFGVPQNRERIYIVGHLRGTSRPKVFPIRRESKSVTTEIKPKEITKDMPQAQRVYDTNGTSVNLKALGGGDGGKTGLYQVGASVGFNHKKDEYKAEASDIAHCIDANYFKGFGSENRAGVLACLTPDRMEKRQNGRRFKDDGEPMFTLTQQDIHGVALEQPVTHNTLTEATGNRAGSSKEFIRSVKNINKAIKQIRRLTPVECERLQGFPDGWTEGLSDTQRYKCMGNAVTTTVVTEVVKRLLTKEK